jgi:hypothetical protein
MPSNGLTCAEKREIDFQNEPKKCISLPNMRLRHIFVASFFWNGTSAGLVPYKNGGTARLRLGFLPTNKIQSVGQNKKGVCDTPLQMTMAKIKRAHARCAPSSIMQSRFIPRGRWLIRPRAKSRTTGPGPASPYDRDKAGDRFQDRRHDGGSPLWLWLYRGRI